jgi:hypothetical protein
MKRTEHQKGFILLMVVALIPLLGMATIVLTSNSRHILTNTRRTALKTHAQFACESGIAWIETNTEKALTNNKLFVLEIDNKNKIVTCTIELISQAGNQSIFTVTGNAKDKRFSYKYPQQFFLKH